MSITNIKYQAVLVFSRRMQIMYAREKQNKTKKNVPERPHIVKNITGRSYKFPLETIIEMCISGHADCRFFFIITVLLGPKIRVSFMSFPESAEALGSANYCWIAESHNKNSSKPRASEQQL